MVSHIEFPRQTFVNKAVFPTSYDYAAVFDVIFITLSLAVILDVKNNYNDEKNA